jgi:hypothetical protein
MVPDPVPEKPPLPLVPFPEKENENAVWAFAGFEDRIMAAAIGKIQAVHFRTAVAGHNAQRIEIAFASDMTIPPPGPAFFASPDSSTVYID